MSGEAEEAGGEPYFQMEVKLGLFPCQQDVEGVPKGRCFFSSLLCEFWALCGSAYGTQKRAPAEETFLTEGLHDDNGKTPGVYIGSLSLEIALDSSDCDDPIWP